MSGSCRGHGFATPSGVNQAVVLVFARLARSRYEFANVPVSEGGIYFFGVNL